MLIEAEINKIRLTLELFFYEDLASIYKLEKDGTKKYGYMNNSGKTVIPMIYESVGPFDNGKAIVKLKGKEFYIDKNGKCVRDCE